MKDPDGDWLDALAGRAPAGSNRAATHEGERLREFIQRNVHTPDVQVPEHDARREAQLLERARRDGLTDPAQRAGRARRPMRPAAIRRLVALAAGVAGIAVALAVFLHGTPRTEHLRSARENVVRIEATDPAALKMEILDELHAAGITATGYEGLGIEGIDAQLPKPVPPGVRAVLARHHLGVPSDGGLKIEIAPPGTP